MLIYDAHNFEALLRAELWDDRGIGTEVFKHVVTTERAISQRADVVLTCSRDDAKLFADVYGVHPDRIWDAPNGVFTDRIKPPSDEEKRAARNMLKIDSPTAIFIGSPFPPNVQAVEFIVERLAVVLPDITFVICGGVAEAPSLSSCRTNAPQNVRFIGLLTEEEKLRYLWAADVGINPMFAGSGTNIKMFDFMSAGLPIVSTALGARGIDGARADGLFVCDAEKMADTLLRVTREDIGRSAGQAARALVIEKYSWERISKRLGERLRTLCEADGRARPAALAGARDSANGSSPSTSSTRQLPAEHRSRLGFISTWANRCGIAEYSRHLADAIETRGWECFVLVYSGNGFLARSVDEADVSVSLENVRKIEDSGGLGVSGACRLAGIDQLLIQHHPGFFGEEILTSIVADCELAGIHTVVTCHNTDQMSPTALLECANTGASIVVHNREEVHRLERSGVHRINYVPHGVLEPPTHTEAGRVPRALGCGKGGPVIGTFGFLRRHKGFLELIEAFCLVRDIYPDSKLVAMTALYPSDESESYLLECASLLSQKGLDHDDGVKFDTGFHEIEDVLDQLKVCDLLVLPYHPTDEGASGSVNVALALRKPVITTSASVFRDTVGYTYRTEGPDPLAIAIAVCNVVSTPDIYGELEAAAARYADERNWNSVAGAYESIVLMSNESTQGDFVAAGDIEETASNGPAFGRQSPVEESLTVSPRLREYALRGHLNVDGRLGVGALGLTIAISQRHVTRGVRGAVGQIGIHHGRYFIVLALSRQAGENAVAIDIFEDQHLNADWSGQGDREAFCSNLLRHDVDMSEVVIHKADSLTMSSWELLALSKGQNYRMFSVDGGHQVANVLHDLELVAGALSPGGVIVLDDFYNPEWPGVNEGLFKLLARSRSLAPFCYGDNKLFLCAGDEQADWLDWVNNEVVPKSSYVNKVILCGYSAFHLTAPEFSQL